LKIVAFFSPVYKLANSFFGGRGNTGVWTRGFALARQALYHLSHALSLQVLSWALCFFVHC
jgi:hypothetical protein